MGRLTDKNILITGTAGSGWPQPRNLTEKARASPFAA